MSYQRDLEHHTYGYGKYGSNILAVGWLSVSYKYNTGKTNPIVLDILSCLTVSRLMRGFHYCEFCGPKYNYEYEKMKINGALGNGEIWADGDNGIKYAMPQMIIHYISKHDYKLPDIVELAVLNRANSTLIKSRLDRFEKNKFGFLEKLYKKLTNH